ncbi:LacI family DNA-binding transcriptional regulator [Paenibacillus wynnii]|uniref:LacI family DNA-binding transcriptional regulator n=1 Tax=Paenibacillus wynnii TaxID=268407 RepID=UPI00278F0949|nr:LacI family DNA-binding transcriptional regulator [Paenibacillus wynnii]MDQ0192514.1 LacI family sucrose operon transcriptional repressor [Paenibacillus wynnii]
MKTIIDIARTAGVAKSTVSRYLNGGSISEATREKIEKIIKQNQYVPNTFAQSLKAKRTSIIGTIVPRLDSYAVSQTLMGIDGELRRRQYQLLIANTNQDMEREIEFIYEMARQKVSGLLLLAAHVKDRHLKAVRECNIPVVLIGQQHSDLHSVIHDDVTAGYLMGKHILEKGHRRIAYLGVTEQDIAVGVRRKEGFQRALREYVDSDVRFYTSGFRMNEAVASAELLFKDRVPSVIVCATDNIALGVMKAASLRHIRIPSGVSVTGFGDYEVTEIVHPALTTMRFYYREVGQLAADNIIALVNGEEVAKVSVSGCEIIERESVDNLTEIRIQ